jgi:hypothetical protein
MRGILLRASDSNVVSTDIFIASHLVGKFSLAVFLRNLSVLIQRLFRVGETNDSSSAMRFSIETTAEESPCDCISACEARSCAILRAASASASTRW